MQYKVSCCVQVLPCKPPLFQPESSCISQDIASLHEYLPEEIIPGTLVSKLLLCNTICPELVVTNALDLALAKHVQTSSCSDPLVLHAIDSLQKSSPLFPCSALMDWTFEGGHLYYKGQMYIPPAARHTLVTSLHNSPALGHVG